MGRGIEDNLEKAGKVLQTAENSICEFFVIYISVDLNNINTTDFNDLSKLPAWIITTTINLCWV